MNEQMERRATWLEAYQKALEERPDEEGWVGKTQLFENYPNGSMPVAYRHFTEQGGEEFFEAKKVGKNRVKYRWVTREETSLDSEEVIQGEPLPVSVIPIGPYIIRTDGPVGQIVGLPEQGVVTLLIGGQTIQIMRGW
tara:strand:- start:3714 stop:4127 length:414 start_codon:yes stop_codon:yes gene_type:complete